MTDWSFGDTWPYQAHWLSTDGLRIHYVDEGPRDGEPVVMLHGHPAWSYLYRHLICGLSEAGYRTIAHDQVGFGRSDKLGRPEDYSVERSVRHLEALVERLVLDQLTLVVHDWGGPLGLAWAIDNPQRLKRLVILNTFTGRIPADAAQGARVWIRLMRSRILGDLLVRGARLPVRVFLLRMGIAHRNRIGKPERAAYLAPHARWGTRAALVAYPRLMPLEEDHPTRALASRIEAGLQKLADKPVLVCHGLKDPGYQAGLLTLGKDRFPDAEVHEFEDASHFLQEDAHERIIPMIIEFLRRT